MKKLWKCSVCGYVFEGAEPPAACPKCGAPAEKFVPVDDEAAQKLYASDRTNDIHAQLITLAMKMTQLCEEGISINLDPPCVGVFTKAREAAWVIKQSCKAELAGHMGKGKFN